MSVTTIVENPDIVGFRLESWCQAIGIGRSGYYALDEKLKPRSVKVGDRRIITEPPREYLARVAQSQRKAA